MRKFNSIEEVLDFAIARESEAHSFYLRFSDKVKNPELVQILRVFATEEAEHRIKLEAFKAGEVTIWEEELCNLNLTDYIPEVKPYPNMSYTELLVVAIKKERFSCKLYTDLAASARTKKLKNLFLKLLREETGHKLRFEREYNSTMSDKKSKI